MSLRKRPWASVLVLGLLTSVPVLASVSTSARQTANEFASRSVSRVGCADFEQYFNQVLAPRLQALRESKEADREYLQNLIWHYSKKRYKKFNQKYEVSSKALMSVVSSYLESGTVSSEALSQVSGVAKRYGIAC
ncbi:hypothetical protein EBZ37_10915, partial [bacterium]|nr:hypothetical protein [bacterium]